MNRGTRHARANGVGLRLGTDDIEGARREDGDDRTGVIRPGSGRVAGEVGDGTLAGRDERVTSGVRQTGAEDSVPTCQLCSETIGVQQLATPRMSCGPRLLGARRRRACFSLTDDPALDLWIERLTRY